MHIGFRSIFLNFDPIKVENFLFKIFLLIIIEISDLLYISICLDVIIGD